MFLLHFFAFKLKLTIQWKSSTCHFLYVLACAGLRDKKPSNRFQRSTNPHGTSKYVYFTIPKHSSSSQPVYFPFLSLPDRKEQCEPPSQSTRTVSIRCPAKCWSTHSGCHSYKEEESAAEGGMLVFKVKGQLSLLQSLHI